ncbi:MAG: hypothetical protein HQ559_11325 [Lentisphaerae bacterium]|nr:hypothetical protein [Lentisphaerota bacterium]
MAAPVLADIGAALYKQNDLELAKDGLPAFLLLLDGLLESDPDNARLLMAAAQAYSAYAMAFVEDEDPARALKLYRKGLDYAKRLVWRHKGLRQAWERPFDAFQAAVAKTRDKDAPALFWVASCWASWINCNVDSVDALADWPKVECLMLRAVELDETYNYAGPHVFLGVYYAARPKQIGGDPDKAKKHFERAFAIAGDDFLLAKVYFAKYYARQTLDEALYEKTLKEVLAAPQGSKPELTLFNTVAKHRAKRLLAKMEDYF